MQESQAIWQDDVRECRRCGEPLTGKHCGECGQKRPGRLTVRGTFSQVMHHVTSLDGVWIRTLIGMTRNPGRVTGRYIAGDRIGYLNPAKYAFLAATAYALVINIFAIDVRPVSARAAYSSPEALAIMRLVVGLLSYTLFLYIVPAAALLRIWFRKARLNLAESYTVLLFFMGHYLLATTLVALAGLFSLPVGFWLARASGFVILWWVLADLFRGSRWRTFFASLSVYVLVLLGGIFSGALAALGRQLVLTFGGST